jgi:pimeloyl-ACP methyl ester carboxylesterase
MATKRIPVVFVHGLWLHATSWSPWLAPFEAAGYAPVAPGWPGEHDTVEAARLDPQRVANRGIDDIVAHLLTAIGALPSAPILIGHSLGALIVEKMIGQGAARAAIAIDPAQVQGVLPLPLARLRVALPALANPLNRARAVSLTKDEFRLGFGSALSVEESDALFQQLAIPSPAKPLFEAAPASFRVPSAPVVAAPHDRRRPLLLVSSTPGPAVPEAVTRAAFDPSRDSLAVTELKQFEGRGASLTIDHGWHDVATACLQWLAAQGM